jgi:2-oxoglutarate dehydrogenase E2 component (dihydrolipoamide succinyltransferase)
LHAERQAMFIDVYVPRLGESVTEATVSKWLVHEGEVVRKDQPLVELGTEKADTEIPSPVAGRVMKIFAREGEVRPVQSVLCQVDEERKPEVLAPVAGGRAAGPPPEEQISAERRAPVAPSEEISRRGGFVPPMIGYGKYRVPPYQPKPGDTVTAVTRHQRIVADHSTYSNVTSPHVVTVSEIDLYEVELLRRSQKESYENDGLSVSTSAFALVAVARALREYPLLNGRMVGDAYVQLADVNVGIVFDSRDGLVVPVVHRVDELGLRGVVRVVDELSERVRTRGLAAYELMGATFSIVVAEPRANLFGGAIINQPNVGCLRMGEIRKRVVVETCAGDDRIAIHPVTYAALSYDHRVVDDITANAFLWRITEILEKAAFAV